MRLQTHAVLLMQIAWSVYGHQRWGIEEPAAAHTCWQHQQGRQIAAGAAVHMPVAEHPMVNARIVAGVCWIELYLRVEMAPALESWQRETQVSAVAAAAAQFDKADTARLDTIASHTDTPDHARYQIRAVMKDTTVELVVRKSWWACGTVMVQSKSETIAEGRQQYMSIAVWMVSGGNPFPICFDGSWLDAGLWPQQQVVRAQTTRVLEAGVAVASCAPHDQDPMSAQIAPDCGVPVTRVEETVPADRAELAAVYARLVAPRASGVQVRCRIRERSCCPRVLVQ